MIGFGVFTILTKFETSSSPTDTKEGKKRASAGVGVIPDSVEARESLSSGDGYRNDLVIRCYRRITFEHSERGYVIVILWAEF